MSQEAFISFSCDYCSEEFDDRVPIKISGKNFCSKQCRDRFFAKKKHPTFKPIASI
jgi:DNA-directed RNA polymerase subunit RPC12/RpoP